MFPSFNPCHVGIQVSLRGGPEFVSLQPVAGPTERYPALGWGLRYAHKVLEERAEYHEITMAEVRKAINMSWD